MSENNISNVRQHLLDTLADLRNREKPMEIDRARAVADVARVLVDSAKVEVDYLKVTGATIADFLEAGAPEARIEKNVVEPNPEAKQEGLPPGITGIRRHVLK